MQTIYQHNGHHAIHTKPTLSLLSQRFLWMIHHRPKTSWAAGMLRVKVGEDDDNDEFMTLPLRDNRIWRDLIPVMS